MDKSRLSDEYYHCLYLVHALISNRYYLTTGRKCALIKKFVLNKHVRLLTRLTVPLIYGNDLTNIRGHLFQTKTLLRRREAHKIIW